MNTLFETSGPTYVTLMYARMRRSNPFSHEDVFKCFHNKFKQPYMVTRSLKRLESHGFVVNTPKGWAITEEGNSYLFLSARSPQGSAK
jgi:ribosomal protein S19E (S16A)